MIKNNKYYNYKTAFSLISTLLFLWILLSDSIPVRQIHNALERPVVRYHLMQNERIKPKDTMLTIVYIDRQSLDAYGPWPWSGRQLTILLNRLINNGASVVAFDLPLSMPAENSAQQVYDWLKKNRSLNSRTTRALKRAIKHFDYHGQLARRLKHQARQQNVILGFNFTNDKIISTGHLPPPINFENKITIRPIYKVSSYKGNTLKIQESMLVGGFINLNSTQKNPLYKTPLILRYGTQIYPSISLQLARNRLLNNKIYLRSANNDTNFITGLNLDKSWIPTDQNGNITFRFQGPPGSYPIVSAKKIISGELLPSVIQSKIKNKAVIVSSNVPHIRPGVKIANKYFYSSAEIHANIVSSILTNQVFSKPLYLQHLDIWLLVFTGLTLSLILPGMKPRQLILVASLFISVWLVYHSTLISSLLYISTLVIPLLLIIFLSSLHYLSSQDSVKLRMLSALRVIQDRIPLLSPIDSSQSDKESISQEQSTVMFVNIQNFSEISEQLNTLELNKLLGLFSTPISSVIMHHHGQINQHIGHSILATWSTRGNLSETMDHALDAALKIRRIAKTLQLASINKNIPPLEIKVGINSGIIKTRSLTWQSRLTCGQAVDSACKLSDLSGFYGVNIIVSKSSKNASPDFYYRQLDTIKITGLANPITIYEPICRTADIDLCEYYELQLYDRAMEYIKENNSKHAISFFSYLHKARPNIVVYKRYLDELQNNAIDNKKTEHNFSA